MVFENKVKNSYIGYVPVQMETRILPIAFSNVLVIQIREDYYVHPLGINKVLFGDSSRTVVENNSLLRAVQR